MIKETDINFYKTFGFLRLPNVFNSKELDELERMFDSYYEHYFKQSMFKIKLKAIGRGATSMVPSFADNQREMIKLFVEKDLFSIPDKLLGNSVQYWGSDGSLFAYGSLWHRDTATLARRMKMNIYLNSGSKNFGAFRLIPGSQNIGDEFSNNLSLACAWPGAAPYGGMSETGFLPRTRSPRRRLLNGFGNTNVREEIPHHIVEFKKGDILLFDDRIIHSVYRPHIPKIRRLITLLFVESASSSRQHVSNLLNFSSESINQELRQLKQFECNQYNVPCYGDALVTAFENVGYAHYLDLLRDIKPTTRSDFKGNHIPQPEDMAQFLTKNYVREQHR